MDRRQALAGLERRMPPGPAAPSFAPRRPRRRDPADSPDTRFAPVTGWRRRPGGPEVRGRKSEARLWQIDGRSGITTTCLQCLLLNPRLAPSRSSQVSLNGYEKQNASKERRPGGVHRVGSPRLSACGPTCSSRESSSWSSTNHGKEQPGLPGSSGLSEFRSGADVRCARRAGRADAARPSSANSSLAP